MEQVPEYAALYRPAFERFGVVALWNHRQFDSPTPEEALAIARPLRVESDLCPRALAEQLEKACQQSEAERRLRLLLNPGPIPNWHGPRHDQSAAADKSPGLMPEEIINEIRRTARYTAAEFAEDFSDPPIDAAAITTTLRRILGEAEEFVLQMPAT